MVGVEIIRGDSKTTGSVGNADLLIVFRLGLSWRRAY